MFITGLGADAGQDGLPVPAVFALQRALQAAGFGLQRAGVVCLREAAEEIRRLGAGELARVARGL